MNADLLVGWALVAIGLYATVAIIVGALVLALVEALKPWADRTVAKHVAAALDEERRP